MNHDEIITMIVIRVANIIWIDRRNRSKCQESVLQSQPSTFDPKSQEHSDSDDGKDNDCQYSFEPEPLNQEDLDDLIRDPLLSAKDKTSEVLVSWSKEET